MVTTRSRVPSEEEDLIRSSGRDFLVNAKNTPSPSRKGPTSPKTTPVGEQSRSPPPRGAKTAAKTVFDLDKIPLKKVTREVQQERERIAARKKAASARLEQEKSHRLDERRNKRREPTPETARTTRAKPPSKAAQMYAKGQAKKAAKHASTEAKASVGPSKVTKKAKVVGPTANELAMAPKYADAIQKLTRSLVSDNEGGYDAALAALKRASEVLPMPEEESEPESPPTKLARRTSRAKSARRVSVDDGEEKEE